jgi:signal transduction histidine kinase
MEHENVFLLWLKARYKLLILPGVVAALYKVLFCLYYPSMEAIGYTTLLAFIITAAICFFDYLGFIKKHRLLKRIIDQIEFSPEHLPEAGSLIEADYQKVIRRLDRDMKALLSNSDAAMRDMEDYFTIWAHQIKTPISAMHLLLQNRELSENDLSAELFKIEQYVETVLSYIRIGSGINDYVIRKYDLDTILKQAIRKFSRLFILKKIRLNYSPPNLQVHTDEKWLQFVFEQLLSNALKYTKEGTISIYCADNSVFIVDTGIGIAPEDLPRVFDKGYTGYNGREDKKATGIGLYQCREVIKRLGHTITIESEVGVGTKVIIGFDTALLPVE